MSFGGRGRGCSDLVGGVPTAVGEGMFPVPPSAAPVMAGLLVGGVPIGKVGRDVRTVGAGNCPKTVVYVIGKVQAVSVITVFCYL